MKVDYTMQELEECLRNIGIASGDHVFIHSNIGFFGRMADIVTSEELCERFLSSIQSVITEKGTLVLPTFSYSFCHDEVYEPFRTRSHCGMLTEYAFGRSDMIRSLDPNFSVTAWGRYAKFYTENPSHESFGEGSFWSRIMETGGKIVCMNFDCGSTFVHYVEKKNNVPYRFNKAFNGRIRMEDGREWRDYAVHYVFEGEQDMPYFQRLDQICRENGIVRTGNLGRGTMLSMDIREYYELICDELRREPRFLTAGG